MRIVLVGASGIAVSAARQMLTAGHEVVVIEEDEAKVELLSEELDCGFVHGDGSRPSVLQQVSPETSDFLFCLTDSDQNNIIAALVGRRQGFERIVVQISDPDYEAICAELEIEETIVPDRETGRALADLVEGTQHVDLKAVVHEGARFFAISIAEEHIGLLSDLGLPEGARACILTRDAKSALVTDDTELRENDELVLAVDDDCMDEIIERFAAEADRSN